MATRTELPGVVPPGGPEPRLEWVRPGQDVVGRLSARLGSDPRAEALLLAVLEMLRSRLAPDSWDGTVDELPYPVRTILRSPGRSGAFATRGGDPVEEVARRVQHPRARARLEVGAVFAALRQVLHRGLSDAIGDELPPDLAQLWRAAD